MVPRLARVEYQYFDAPTNFTEDKWVQAMEIMPGAREAVHHILLYATVPPAPGAATSTPATTDWYARATAASDSQPCALRANRFLVLSAAPPHAASARSSAPRFPAPTSSNSRRARPSCFSRRHRADVQCALHGARP